MKDVFHRALERPRDERAAFVADLCAGDTRLASDVRSLLSAHEQAGSFLSEPASSDLVSDLTGRIGPHRVLGKIGQGGMGAVFRAARDDDVFEKTVALKVVRGDAGPEVVRRFVDKRPRLAEVAAVLVRCDAALARGAGKDRDDR